MTEQLKAALADPETREILREYFENAYDEGERDHHNGMQCRRLSVDSILAELDAEVK